MTETRSPRVSIVLPCFNNAQSLTRTVESIRAQTVDDWVLIAVDDGSSDDTLRVLNGLAEGEPRMRVIHQENAGVSAARNAGMDAAQGEWVFFIDADDWLMPHALEHLLSMTADDLDIVCGAYEIRFRDEGGRTERHACASGDLQVVMESLLRGDSALNSMCARLYRRAMLKNEGVRAPLGVKIGEDVLFNLDAFYAARAWRMSEEIIYIYEFGGNSAMTRAKSGVYEKTSPMIDGIERFIDQHKLATALFRAHIDLYLRMLRADRGRLRAAFAFDGAIVARITKGVEFGRLCAKQKLYYAALRLCPISNYLLP